MSSDPLVWKLVGTRGKIGPMKVGNPAWRWMSLDEAGIVPYAAPDDPKPQPEEPDTFDHEQRIRAIEERLNRHVAP